MSSDNEQKSVNVPQHKRIAQGEKLDGTSYILIRQAGETRRSSTSTT